MSHRSPISQKDSVRDTIAFDDTTVSIRYTGITAETPLTKRMSVGEDSVLVKRAAANPGRGVFTDIEHNGSAADVLDAYANVLRGLTPYQAIIASRLPSPLRPNGERWLLTTKHKPEPGALARSRATFRPVSGPALLSLDFDIPPALRQEFKIAFDLYRKVLIPAWPSFSGVAMLVRPSVSSGAKLAGREEPLPTGYHVACIVSNGSRNEELAAALFDRIALSGFALVEASRCGAALKRALVDVAAAKGSERLIFEADPVIGEGVERIARPFSRHPGGILDVGVALAAMALTSAERKQLKSIWADLVTNARPELEAAKEKWLGARGGEIAKARNVEPKEGRRIAEREATSFDAGVLRDDYPIHLDTGEWVTVYDILRDPGKYRGARCWSLDETVSRPGVGFVQPYSSRPDPSCGKPPGPWVHSFEHGGRYWGLRSESVALTNYRKFKADQNRNKGHG